MTKRRRPGNGRAKAEAHKKTRASPQKPFDKGIDLEDYEREHGPIVDVDAPSREFIRAHSSSLLSNDPGRPWVILEGENVIGRSASQSGASEAAESYMRVAGRNVNLYIANVAGGEPIGDIGLVCLGPISSDAEETT
jgi:hypothetical protein